METIDRPLKKLARRPPPRDPERLTPHQVRWDNAGLGTRPDPAIAADMGVSPEVVARERQMRRIPSFTEQIRGKPISVIDWDTVRLGHKPDVAIAAELGVDASMVSKARRRRGVRPFVDPNRLKGERTCLTKDER